jgi:hypothetical protein
LEEAYKGKLVRGGSENLSIGIGSDEDILKTGK